MSGELLMGPDEFEAESDSRRGLHNWLHNIIDHDWPAIYFY